MTGESLIHSDGYSLPFIEPHTPELLIIGSFLYLLNVIHGVFEFLFGAGLVGQLVLGAIYCVPLGDILPIDIQTSLGAIGYWGLLLLIVEGGLGTRFDILTKRNNLILCLLVALSGICLPIGFGMSTLYFGYKYTILESFVIGAALSVTSLGTTIAIMSSISIDAPEKSDGNTLSGQQSTSQNSSSNIGDTRVGTILMGAAVIDDVPGLVISSVVSDLGSANALSKLSAWDIARPIATSVALLLVTAVLAKFIAPLFVKRLSSVLYDGQQPLQPSEDISETEYDQPSEKKDSSVSQSYQAGASPDSKQSPGFEQASPTANNQGHSNQRLKAWCDRLPSSVRSQFPNIALFLFISVIFVYITIAHYIGSSRLIGAFCAGSLMSHAWKLIQQHTKCDAHSVWSPHASFKRIEPVQAYILAPFFFASIGAAIPVRSLFQATTAWRGILFSALMIVAKLLAGGWLPIWAALERRWPLRRISDQESLSEATPSASPAWPAGMLVGLALVTRGEIGLLILNIAKAQELVGDEGFSVGIWAVVLSTLVGPIGVGTLLRTRAVNWIIRGPWGLPPS
ncbi:Sodium/hydrogen exchanger family [Rhizoctonia solani]|uniref:Sodium/hydrogen exchanger family n=1 Tax=Rhizoctonia solani TaxID=456999 RepID=A0A8H7HFL8_9AGAM|nr:Sodium/hydrogen exchanger family [Rhizoctonia solani]